MLPGWRATAPPEFATTAEPGSEPPPEVAAVQLLGPEAGLSIRIVFRGLGAERVADGLTPAVRVQLLELLAPALAAAAPSANRPTTPRSAGATRSAQAPPTFGAAPAEGPPPHVLRLGERLTVQQGLDGAARVARCWALGCRDNAARRQLARGERPARELSPVPRLGASEWHVCLAGPAGAPFWTTSARRFAARVRVQNLPGRPYVAGFVGRSFPSKAEAESYLDGAGFAIPPQI